MNSSATLLQDAREAHQTLAQEAAGLRQDNTKLRSAAVDAAESNTQDINSFEARMERLRHSLEEANIAAEVNQAKADAYDEVDRQLTALKEDNRQLRAAQANALMLDEEIAAIRGTEKVRTTLHGSCCMEGKNWRRCSG